MAPILASRARSHPLRGHGPAGDQRPAHHTSLALSTPSWRAWACGTSRGSCPRCAVSRRRWSFWRQAPARTPDRYHRFTRQFLSELDRSYALTQSVGKYRLYRPSSLRRPMAADFGGQVTLAGYRLDPIEQTRHNDMATGREALGKPPLAGLPSDDEQLHGLRPSGGCLRQALGPARRHPLRRHLPHHALGGRRVGARRAFPGSAR